MKRRLDRLKQAALERMGVAESTQVPKIKEDYKKVKSDEVLFKELLKYLEKQLAYLNGYVESGEGIKANLAAWEKVSMERGENFKLVEGLKRFGEWQTSLNQHFSKLHQSMSERVVEVTKNFVKVDVAEARSQKKKWVKLRQAYDASEANLAAAERGNKAKDETHIKEEHNEIMRSYLKAEVDTSATLEKTLKGCETLLVGLVGQYWDVYSSLFLQTSQLVERVKTSLDSLQLSPSFGTLSRVKSMSSPPLRITPDDDGGSKSLVPRFPRVPSTKIFGIYLQDLWDEKSHSFPRNLVQVLEHLEEHGPNEEEIFKSPGNTKHVAAIKKGLDEAVGTGLNSIVLGDSLSVAMVLRDFLIQLPDPVIPFHALPQYINDVSGVSDPSEKIEAVLRVNCCLPEPHKKFLEMILQMGGVICRNPFSDLPPAKATKYSNDMAIDLSVVLGPACMRANASPPDQVVETAAIHLFKFLFLNADSLCPERAKPAGPRNSQRGSGASTSITDVQKLEITQLITDIIGNLDIVKMRAAAAISLEECTPFVLRIKNVLENTQQVKSMVISEVARIDKSALHAGTGATQQHLQNHHPESKLARAQNAVRVFSSEVQAILTALLHDISHSSTSSTSPTPSTQGSPPHFTSDQLRFAITNLSKTQSMLLL